MLDIELVPCNKIKRAVEIFSRDGFVALINTLSPAQLAFAQAGAQRVVEVGRVHLRALVRRACTQPRQCIECAAPRLHERAIAGAVLQADRVEAVVQRADVHRARERAHRCLLDVLPGAVRRRRPGAVHRCVFERAVRTTAHLEAAVRDRALDEQTGRLDGPAPRGGEQLSKKST